MTKENEKLLSDLCALRAGLSLLSQNYDGLKVDQDTISTSENTVATISKRTCELKTELQSSKDEYQRSKQNRENTIKEHVRGTKHFNLLSMLRWPFDLTINFDFFDTHLLLGFALEVLCAILIFPFYLATFPIQCIVYAVKKSKLKKEWTEIIDKQLAELEAAIKDNEKLYGEMLDLQKEKMPEINKSILEKKENVKSLISSSDETYQVLVQQYESIILERDWEGLDLIIWYLSSGRADSKKEALQLYDRQKQTDQIVDSIESVRRDVCAMIEQSTRLLGETMVQSFNVLSEQMNFQHEQTMSAIGALGDSMAENAKKISLEISALKKQSVSKQDLEKALLNKKNTDSGELMRDVRSLKVEIKKLQKQVG